ncbi:MAG: L,D-transpeptidase family protein, partial [Gammaproteobacteria bacterium]|nr:L,D-transpeptidase family protein [Gammaproteobacteria bacterium]
MTRIRNRLKSLRLALALAAMAPLGLAQAQGFSSVSSGTPDSAVAAPSGAGTAPASVAVLAANSAAPGASPGSPVVASPPASAGVAPIVPAPPALPSGAGTAVSVIPASTAPAAPVAPRPETFSSGSGSFSSVSGSAPSLPVPPPATASHGAGSSSSFEMADKVVVIKHERVLRLLRRGRVIAEYPVRLGLNPYGHKQREGDFRTPEGRYELDFRNPRSEFFLSIKISYPNREDAAVAHESGFKPGGLIMIHGQPNEPKRPLEYYATRDWTDGCIALSNADMVDVWLRTT